MMASAEEQGMPRLSLTLHVFGSAGVGKKTLKVQWFESSHSRVLSEIADIHIRIHRDCVFNAQPDPSAMSNSSFLVLYRADSQNSIMYTSECLEMIYKSFPEAKVDVLENHFEPTFKPHGCVPQELPSCITLAESIKDKVPSFWRVKLINSVQTTPLLGHLITQPVLSFMDDYTRAMVIAKACREGKLQVLKLLAGTVEETTPITWLTNTMHSLEQRSPKQQDTADLVSVAQYAYTLDQTLSLSTIVRLANIYPKASLYLLDTFCQQSTNAVHFVKSGLALVHLPPSWVANTSLTHVDLSNNLLTQLPRELFQLAQLKALNISRNCLEAIPSILQWNCPLLRDLNVSHNRLVDVPYTILEGRNRSAETRSRSISFPTRPNQRRHMTAAQRLLRLTGYNLYPCLRSLSRVNISHNSSLTQVPEWVCVLPHLTLLEMTALPKLTRLTPYLSYCRYLCVIRLDPENLVSPPAEEAQRGTRSIVAYLRCELRGCIPYRHVKLVLIGNSGSGKKTLLQQLMGGRGGAVMSGSQMTIGSFKFRPKMRLNAPKVNFHVITFAGNEVYRCTHQCFLTHRSIYICLWDVTHGVESLGSLVPWLRSIQACAPGSPTILVGTHKDRRPGLSVEVIRQWQEEVFGDVTRLHRRAYSSSVGFPPLVKTILMDATSKDSVELLLTDIYDTALRMRHPRTKVPFLEDVVPRSYQDLQNLVELKVKSMRRSRNPAPILRHEEFVDYIHSLTISHEDLENDDEELALATRFLHEVGTIVHFRSHMAGVSDLYFLDPQWLFDTLAHIVSSRLSAASRSAVVHGWELPFLFGSAQVPQQHFNSFLSFMESFHILVSLDMEKSLFLIPSLLPDTPPPNYPSYSPQADSWITQYIQFNYLPNGLFPRLLARVLIYIRQLSGQLLVEGASPLIPGEDSPDGSFLSVPSRHRSSFFSHSHSFRLDRRGYINQEESEEAADEGSLRNKIWALSKIPVSHPLTHRRQKALTEKLVSISRTIFQHCIPSKGSSIEWENEPASSASHTDQFASYLFWKKGLFVEFPYGTKFWIEACQSAVAIVICGELVPRVKVLSFLTSCVDVLVEECFGGLEVVTYSPCPQCLGQFWDEDRTSRGHTPSFMESSLEVSQSYLKLDEFNELAEFSRRGPEESISPSHTRRYSFSGSSLRISRSPSPLQMLPEAVSTQDKVEVAMLAESVTLFPLSTTILQSLKSSTISCPHCQTEIELTTISPHVLLVDFSDNLLLDPGLLRFTEDEDSLLGSGGFAKVLEGSYGDRPVAVKLFRRASHKECCVREYRDLREELTIMSHLSHPRVVTLLGVCLKPLCMIMPLAAQGSLGDHLELCPQGIDDTIAHRLLFQLADGIRYLHSLYIVHRDIKPSNILVWSLHPERGVDIRLADYGISQFSTPSGLWRHKGTEEYMAPELFNSRHHQAYDEKVDVFSYALVLHQVVTGRRLFAGIVNKREQLQMLFNCDVPKLSEGLGQSMEEKSPQVLSKHPEWLEGGRHPVARKDAISSCHSVCMQQLVEDCLSEEPSYRPSAQGICSRLLVCPGSLRQVNFFTGYTFKRAAYSANEEVVVGMGEDDSQLLVMRVGSWEIKTVTPLNGEKIACFTCAGNEVFLASAETFLIYSLQLPSLNSAGHISHQPLPDVPLCLFPHSSHNGLRLVVGMSAGRIAVFSSPGDGRHLLESKPLVTQAINHPDADKTAIHCGVFHRKTVWCGCGRQLIGMDTKNYMMKHYKPVIKEVTSVTHMAAASGYLWLGFEGRDDLVVCDTSNALSLGVIRCSALLNIPSVCHSQSYVTSLVSSSGAIWVGTQGGHLMAFDSLTAELLLVNRRHSSIYCVLPLDGTRLISFGEGPVESEDQMTMFTVWTSYVAHRHT